MHFCENAGHYTPVRLLAVFFRSVSLFFRLIFILSFSGVGVQGAYSEFFQIVFVNIFLYFAYFLFFKYSVRPIIFIYTTTTIKGGIFTKSVLLRVFRALHVPVLGVPNKYYDFSTKSTS